MALSTNSITYKQQSGVWFFIVTPKFACCCLAHFWALNSVRLGFSELQLTFLSIQIEAGRLESTCSVFLCLVGHMAWNSELFIKILVSWTCYITNLWGWYTQVSTCHHVSHYFELLKKWKEACSIGFLNWFFHSSCFNLFHAWSRSIMSMSLYFGIRKKSVTTPSPPPHWTWRDEGLMNILQGDWHLCPQNPGPGRGFRSHASGHWKHTCCLWPSPQPKVSGLLLRSQGPGEGKGSRHPVLTAVSTNGNEHWLTKKAQHQAQKLTPAKPHPVFW